MPEKCEYKHTERVGLYIMVYTCDLGTHHRKIMDKFKAVEKKIELIEKGGDCYEDTIGIQDR